MRPRAKISPPDKLVNGCQAGITSPSTQFKLCILLELKLDEFDDDVSDDDLEEDEDEDDELLSLFFPSLKSIWLNIIKDIIRLIVTNNFISVRKFLTLLIFFLQWLMVPDEMMIIIDSTEMILMTEHRVDCNGALQEIPWMTGGGWWGFCSRWWGDPKTEREMRWYW